MRWRSKNYWRVRSIHGPVVGQVNGCRWIRGISRTISKWTSIDSSVEFMGMLRFKKSVASSDWMVFGDGIDENGRDRVAVGYMVFWPRIPGVWLGIGVLVLVTLVPQHHMRRRVCYKTDSGWLIGCLFWAFGSYVLYEQDNWKRDAENLCWL